MVNEDLARYGSGGRYRKFRLEGFEVGGIVWLEFYRPGV